MILLSLGNQVSGIFIRTSVLLNSLSELALTTVRQKLFQATVRPNMFILSLYSEEQYYSIVPGSSVLNVFNLTYVISP